jgi:hypothetical protein
MAPKSVPDPDFSFNKAFAFSGSTWYRYLKAYSACGA